MDMSNGKRWIVVVIYTLIILATLPFVRNVWDWVGEWQGYILLIGLYLGAAGFIYIRYKNILFVGLIFLISLAIFKLIPLPIERIHFIEYGVLGWLVWRAAGDKKWGFAVALVYIIAISVLDEAIQGILPSRYYDLRDIWMNILGGSLGLVIGRYEK